MRRFAIRALMFGLALVVGLQFVRPTRTNPPIDQRLTLEAQIGSSHPAVPVIARACQNCHSSETSWPWYSKVAPISWLVAHDVAEARTAVNFSNWSAYGPEQQRKLLKESCSEVREGEMPLSMYVLLHPEAKLDAADVRAVCGLSQTEKMN